MDHFDIDGIIKALLFDFVRRRRFQLRNGGANGFLCLGFIFDVVHQAAALGKNPVAHLQFQRLIRFGVGICEDVQAKHVVRYIFTAGGKAGEGKQHG